MKDAIQIASEIKILESRIANLKAELLALQATCSHHLVRNELTSICTRCLKSESLYY